MIRPSLAAVFFCFLRLGMTAFGGPAMIPYIRRKVVDEHSWLAPDEFQAGIGLSQTIPGATAMQMAAYSGLRVRGGFGALAAYVGFAIPAFVLILALSWLYFTSRDVAQVQAAFLGMQVVVVALVTNAAIDFTRRFLTDVPAFVMALAAGLWLGFKGNPILAIIAVCSASVLVYRHDVPNHARHGIRGGLGIWRTACVTLVFMILGLILLAVFNPAMFELATLMVRIDFFAFGGGYVSLPLMLHEVVEVKGWMPQATFMDGIALGQITPGPVVMTAAFIGYGVTGIVGALVATVAVFSPSFFMMALIAPIYERMSGSAIFLRAVRGSVICLVGLMGAMAIRFAMVIDWGPLEIFAGLAALAALAMKADILFVVLAGAVVFVLSCI